MKLRSALLAATVLAMPFAASAQPVTGLYVGAGVGLNITTQEKVKNLSFPTLAPLGGGLSTSGNFNGSTGFAGVVSVGWGFGNGLRAEIEGNYRNNISMACLASAPAISPAVPPNRSSAPWATCCTTSTASRRGSCRTLAPVWAIRAFQMSTTSITRMPGQSAPAQEGLPSARVHCRSLARTQPVRSPIRPSSVRPSRCRKSHLAWRLPRNTGSSAQPATGRITASPRRAHSLPPAKVQLGPTYNNSILVGLRYNFGVAPPPPPPAAVVPAQAPARSYLVFFDWDKATLTDRARQIIHEAADNSTRVQYTRIEVNGYTDTSGTPRYNQGLSVRRANAVAGRTGQGRRAEERHHDPGLRRHASAGADWPRRARAAEPSRRDHHPLTLGGWLTTTRDGGAARRPFSSVPEEDGENAAS